MQKRLAGFLLTLCMVLTLLPTAVFAADTATPSDTKFVINGKSVSVSAAYVINNTNYLQLRAIAEMLNGTSAQFDVSWDGQYAVIEPGKPYSGKVTETKLKTTTDVRKSDTKFKMNGNVFTFSDARLIDGGTNYIQLREFAQKLSGTASQFNVYWDSAAGQAVIQPGVAYTGNPPQGTVATTPKPKGGTKRTINMENQLVIDISNTYAYARITGYGADGATIVYFVIVPEGATITCTKYVSPYKNDTRGSYCMWRPFSSIYFRYGALWPSITYATDYDDREEGEMFSGESITAINGYEYNFETGSSDKAITSKYGNVGAAHFILRVFVVPDEIGAKIGGSKPAELGFQTYLNEFYVPSGAGSDPFTYSPDPDAMLLAHNGWYYLSYDYVLPTVRVEFDAKGRAAINEYTPTMFYVERVGKQQITMRFADGNYLGVDGNPVDGAKTKAVSTPYIWNIYYENNAGNMGGNMYSLRPSTNTELALTVSGTVKEGTPVILSTQKNMNAPRNAEFTFLMGETPQSFAFTMKMDDLGDDGIYYIRPYKDPAYAVDCKSYYDGADIILYSLNGEDWQKFRFIKVKDNQYIIQSAYSGKLWTSHGTAGRTLAQYGSGTYDERMLFTIEKQEDGSYRIMDSKGLHVTTNQEKIGDDVRIILSSKEGQTFLFEKDRMNPSSFRHSKPEPISYDQFDDLKDDGVYTIMPAKAPYYNIDVNGESKSDGAKLILWDPNGKVNQQFRITRVEDDQYTIQCMHSNKWVTSSGEKASVLTQAGNVPDRSAITFTIKKQADGSYRIMDSKGLVVSVSGGKMEGGTNIILWTSDTSQTFVFKKID